MLEYLGLTDDVLNKLSGITKYSYIPSHVPGHIAPSGRGSPYLGTLYHTHGFRRGGYSWRRALGILGYTPLAGNPDVRRICPRLRSLPPPPPNKTLN